MRRSSEMMDANLRYVLLTLMGTSATVLTVWLEPSSFRALVAGFPAPNVDSWLHYLFGPGLWLFIPALGIPFVVWYLSRVAIRKKDVTVVPERKKPVAPTAKEYASEPVSLADQLPPIEAVEVEQEREEAWERKFNPPKEPALPVPANVSSIDFEEMLAQKIISDPRWRLSPTSKMSMIKDPETKKMKMEMTKIDFEIPEPVVHDTSPVQPKPESQKFAVPVPPPPEEE